MLNVQRSCQASIQTCWLCHDMPDSRYCDTRKLNRRVWPDNDFTYLPIYSNYCGGYQGLFMSNDVQVALRHWGRIAAIQIFALQRRLIAFHH